MESTDRCPQCGSKNLIHDYDRGEIICGNCGLVIRQIVDRGPDWRAFSPEERESRPRAGAPESLLVHDKGLSTTFPIGHDAFGRKLPPPTRFQMWRLKRWQIYSRVKSAMDRNLAQAITELKRLSDKLNIPKPVRREAALIYRKALEKGLVRGRSITCVIAGALYLACRFTKTPRTLQEISEASVKMNGVEVKWHKKEIAHCYRLLLKELDIKVPIAEPLTYISKIAGKTNISETTQGLAIEILRRAQKKGLTRGRGPMGLAAAALYIACLRNEEWVAQRELAYATGVTEVTIRNRYKELEEELNLKVPQKQK